jgi:hypothetical protein
MATSITAVPLAAVLALSLLGGCDKASNDAPNTEAIAAPVAPAAPDKPDAPEAVPAAKADAKTAHATPAAPAPAASTESTVSASVSTTGAEARAGDVSVKLPQ